LLQNLTTSKHSLFSCFRRRNKNKKLVVGSGQPILNKDGIDAKKEKQRWGYWCCVLFFKIGDALLATRPRWRHDIQHNVNQDNDTWQIIKKSATRY